MAILLGPIHCVCACSYQTEIPWIYKRYKQEIDKRQDHVRLSHGLTSHAEFRVTVSSLLHACQDLQLCNFRKLGPAHNVNFSEDIERSVVLSLNLAFPVPTKLCFWFSPLHIFINILNGCVCCVADAAGPSFRKLYENSHIALAGLDPCCSTILSFHTGLVVLDKKFLTVLTDCACIFSGIGLVPVALISSEVSYSYKQTDVFSNLILTDEADELGVVFCIGWWCPQGD